MKKFYSFFTIATFAIFALQALLINNLYKNYISSESEHIENSVRKSLDPNNYLQLFNNQRLTNFYRYIVGVKSKKQIKELKQHDIETLNILVSSEGDLKKMLRRELTIDKQLRLTLDEYFENDIVMNTDSLNTLFRKKLNRDYNCIIELHNSHYIMQNLENHYNNTEYNFVLSDYPIGSKGYQFIKVYAAIPLSYFIKSYIWILLSSVIIMLLILGLLLHLIAVIRAKQRQITMRENNIYGMMHDLKSPLSGVAMTLDYAKTKVNNPQIENIFSLNQSKIKHMIDGIDSLLTFVGNKHHTTTIGITREELDESLNIMVTDLNNIYIHKPHSFVLNIQYSDCNKLNININNLENIIRNLIENSLKYSDNGVVVELNVDEQNSFVKFQIVDNG